MFPYQIRKYWQNAMYAQNTVNPNISFPASCRCSRVIVFRRWPAERRASTSNTAVERLPRMPPVQKYTPKMVLNQLYWRLISTSNAKNVLVSPRSTTTDGAYQC